MSLFLQAFVFVDYISMTVARLISTETINPRMQDIGLSVCLPFSALQ